MLPLTRFGRRIICLLLLAAVTSCTPGHHAPQAPTPSTGRPTNVARGAPSLTPSIPDVFRTGTNACGNPYAISATTIDGTVPLVDCPGFAGLHPTPTVTVAIGGQVLISGVPSNASVTSAPSGLLVAHGGSYVAVQPGITTLTIHGYSCLPNSDGAQPATCSLLRVQAN